MLRKSILTLCIASLMASASFAEDWGTVKGKLVFDGDQGKAAALKINKDLEACGNHNLVDESVVVGEDGGLANVVVYIYVKRGGDPPPIHESYNESADANVEVDNHNCRFEPHIGTLRTTQTLVIGNKDEVGHNTKIDTLKNAGINPVVPAGSTHDHQFTEPESRPVPVSCAMHTWMKGYLLVKDHPYMAVTSEDGTFEIANVPSGKWTFQFWHEKANYLDSVSVNGAATKWKKGRVEVDVKSGDNDMGTISVAAKEFE